MASAHNAFQPTLISASLRIKNWSKQGRIIPKYNSRYSIRYTDYQIVFGALSKIQAWNRHKPLPNYNHGFGALYLGYLTGLVDGFDLGYDFYDLSNVLFGKHRGLLKALNGTNGFTILNMLIARKGLRDDR